MNRTLDPAFSNALRSDLVEHVTAAQRSKGRRRLWLGGGAVCTAAAVFVAGTTTASGPRVPDAPLSAPALISGIGPGAVKLPPAPANATYVRVELVCFEATRCDTPGGGGTSEQPSKIWQRDAIPLTAAMDPTNPQRLKPLDPAVGLPIETDRDVHWRLYATFVDRLNPRSTMLKDGRLIGIPDNASPTPSLVPIDADNGRAGFVNMTDLLGVADLADPSQPATGSLPVYDTDGTTVIGQVSVG